MVSCLWFTEELWWTTEGTSGILQVAKRWSDKLTVKSNRAKEETWSTEDTICSCRVSYPINVNCSLQLETALLAVSGVYFFIAAGLTWEFHTSADLMTNWSKRSWLINCSQHEKKQFSGTPRLTDYSFPMKMQVLGVPTLVLTVQVLVLKVQELQRMEWKGLGRQQICTLTEVSHLTYYYW